MTNIIEKIVELREKIAAHDVTFWEASPAILAIFLPSILVPEWFWRLFALLLASSTLFVVCVHGLLAPEQIANFKNARSLTTKKYLFWLLYVTGLLLTPFIIVFLLIPSGSDLYRVIHDPSAALDKKVIEVKEWGGGGSVTPFFIGQRFETTSETYYLPFSFTAWGVGNFEVLYSPATNIIYEIKKYTESI
jgi:hypothetical protein